MYNHLRNFEMTQINTVTVFWVDDFFMNNKFVRRFKSANQEFLFIQYLPL